MIPLILLVVTMGIMGGLFILAQILVVMRKDTGKRIINAQEMVAAYKEKEVLARLVKDKTVGITGVLLDRFDFPTLFKKYREIIPPESTLTDLSAGRDGRISATVRTPSAEILGKYFTSLKIFKGVIIDSISGNKDEGYQAIVSFNAK